MLKRKIIVGIAACSIMLAGCVSEQSYVGSEKPVASRTFDNIEAARTRISLGLNYLRRGDSSQAKYNLERARSFAPNSAEVYSALAYYYENVGESDQAEEYYLIAIEKDPNYADAYNNYGAFLCQLHKYEASERLLLKAISRSGYIRVAESYENLALCQLQQNNFRKTKSYLESSIKHNGTRISSLILSAGLSYAMGEMNDAKNQLARIQRLGRVSARTVLLSYLIADKSGDTTTKNNAEQLLLTLYMGSAETTLLLQDKLQNSEFELLRERYKETLMANITLPTDRTGSAVVTQPVVNPKLKVVKRKIADAADEKTDGVIPPAQKTATANTSNNTPSLVKMNSAVVTTSAATLPVLSNATSDIANSLAAKAKPAATVAASPVADSPVTVITSEQLAALTAEQATESATKIVETTAVVETAASSITLVATPASTLPKETKYTQVTAEETLIPSALKPAEIVTQPITDDAVDATVTTTELVADSDLGVTGAESEQKKYHLVQTDDSLYAISVKYNIRLPRLMEWNQLTPESTIQTGQKIWLQQMPVPEFNLELNKELNSNTKSQIPSRIQVTTTESYHQVAAGETMFAISYRYNIKLDKFMAWNKLTEQSKLHIGQQLLVVDPALQEL